MEEEQSNRASRRAHRPHGIVSTIVEDLPMLLMFALGSIIFWDLGWPYALIYLAFCGFALGWFMRSICTYCGNARLGRCPSGMGRIALRLFEKPPPDTLAASSGGTCGCCFPAGSPPRSPPSISS